MLNISLHTRHMVNVDAPQTGQVTDRVFEQGPKPARPMEALVVESYGKKAVQFIEDPKYIEAKCRPASCGADR